MNKSVTTNPFSPSIRCTDKKNVRYTGSQIQPPPNPKILLPRTSDLKTIITSWLIKPPKKTGPRCAGSQVQNPLKTPKSQNPKIPFPRIQTPNPKGYCLASRAPRSSLRSVGSPPVRKAARAPPASLPHEPPRRAKRPLPRFCQTLPSVGAPL
jgi:hypothetical protein